MRSKEKKNKKINQERKDKELEFKLKDKKLKRIEYLVGVIVILLIIILITYLSIPKIYTDIKIRYNTEYKDIDYKAKSYFKDYTNHVKVENNIDTSKIGKYKIKFILPYGLIKIIKTKEIAVIDDIKPEIELIGDNNLSICPNKKYVEIGYKAYDEYEGDITDKVITKEEQNKIKYIVQDNSGNEYITSRIINYEDKEKPNIELKENKIIYLYKGNIYEEPGYIATDNCDGDITNKVEVTGEVNTNKIGTYTLTYKVSDLEGNTQEVTRQIKIIEYNQNNNTKGVIYLTFDDGPSNLTTEILNILKEENIKATFFVTGNVDDFPSILKREASEGHTIALHTYSHNYSYLYSNKDNFFKDLDKVNNSVERITGTRSNIIRFPGGSSNTVSKKYYTGIMTYLTEESLNRGYIYYDWNVDSNDAGSSIYNEQEIYNNVIKNLSYSGTNIVLMHDSGSHTSTVKALKNIINYSKANGYTFKKIDNTTPAIRHKVNN